MFFNNPWVRRHLLATGRVYTLRAKRRRREGAELLVTGSLYHAQRLGTGLVACVKELEGLTPRALAPYVRGSGMESGAEWIRAFLGFVRGRPPSVVYLYHVQLLRVPDPATGRPAVPQKGRER
jgi:hypothetical protein